MLFHCGKKFLDRNPGEEENRTIPRCPLKIKEERLVLSALLRSGKLRSDAVGQPTERVLKTNLTSIFWKFPGQELGKQGILIFSPKEKPTNTEMVNLCRDEARKGIKGGLHNRFSSHIETSVE